MGCVITWVFFVGAGGEQFDMFDSGEPQMMNGAPDFMGENQFEEPQVRERNCSSQRHNLIILFTRIMNLNRTENFQINLENYENRWYKGTYFYDVEFVYVGQWTQWCILSHHVHRQGASRARETPNLAGGTEDDAGEERYSVLLSSRKNKQKQQQIQPTHTLYTTQNGGVSVVITSC